MIEFGKDTRTIEELLTTRSVLDQNGLNNLYRYLLRGFPDVSPTVPPKEYQERADATIALPFDIDSANGLVPKDGFMLPVASEKGAEPSFKHVALTTEGNAVVITELPADIRSIVKNPELFTEKLDFPSYKIDVTNIHRQIRLVFQTPRDGKPSLSVSDVLVIDDKNGVISPTKIQHAIIIDLVGITVNEEIPPENVAAIKRIEETVQSYIQNPRYQKIAVVQINHH